MKKSLLLLACFACVFATVGCDQNKEVATTQVVEPVKPVKPAPAVQPKPVKPQPATPEIVKPKPVPVAAADPVVVLETTAGKIEIQMNPTAAPGTVKNFITYVKQGYYNKTIFHRTIKGFMIQGGGMTAAGRKKPTQKEIRNEATNGLKNVRGTIAMARTGEPHSASAQFFINDGRKNTFLNHVSTTIPGRYGYCVFGKVIKGMDVVDKIAAGKVGRQMTGEMSRPLVPVTVTKAYMKK